MTRVCLLSLPPADGTTHGLTNSGSPACPLIDHIARVVPVGCGRKDTLWRAQVLDDVSGTAVAGGLLVAAIAVDVSRGYSIAVARGRR